MRFVVDADLPCKSVHLLRQYGHDAEDVRDIGMGAATDEEIAAYSRTHQSCLMTGDFGFADVRRYPPEAYSGIVVYHLPYSIHARTILQLMEGFISQPQLLQRLPGRLAIVEFGRVRFRPP